MNAYVLYTAKTTIFLCEQQDIESLNMVLSVYVGGYLPVCGVATVLIDSATSPIRDGAVQVQFLLYGHGC